MVRRETLRTGNSKLLRAVLIVSVFIFQIAVGSAQSTVQVFDYTLYNQDGIRIRMELVKPAIPCGENSRDWLYKITVYNLEKITADRRYLSWRMIVKNCSGYRVKRFFQIDLLAEKFEDEVQIFKLDWKFEAASLESNVMNVQLRAFESEEKDENLDEKLRKEIAVAHIPMRVDTPVQLAAPVEPKPVEKEVGSVDYTYRINPSSNTQRVDLSCWSSTVPVYLGMTGFSSACGVLIYLGSDKWNTANRWYRNVYSIDPISVSVADFAKYQSDYYTYSKLFIGVGAGLLASSTIVFLSKISAIKRNNRKCMEGYSQQDSKSLFKLEPVIGKTAEGIPGVGITIAIR